MIKAQYYDQYGHVDPNQGMVVAAVRISEGGFGDIFDMFFGGGGGGTTNPNAPQRGNDLQYTMTIEFKEAIFGKELDITIPRTENCDTVSWFRCEAGTKPETCGGCKGVRTTRGYSEYGFWTYREPSCLFRLVMAKANSLKKNARIVTAPVKLRKQRKIKCENSSRCR